MASLRLAIAASLTGAVLAELAEHAALCLGQRRCPLVKEALAERMSCRIERAGDAARQAAAKADARAHENCKVELRRVRLGPYLRVVRLGVELVEYPHVNVIYSMDSGRTINFISIWLRFFNVVITGHRHQTE